MVLSLNAARRCGKQVDRASVDSGEIHRWAASLVVGAIPQRPLMRHFSQRAGGCCCPRQRRPAPNRRRGGGRAAMSRPDAGEVSSFPARSISAQEPSDHTTIQSRSLRSLWDTAHVHSAVSCRDGRATIDGVAIESWSRGFFPARAAILLGPADLTCSKARCVLARRAQ